MLKVNNLTKFFDNNKAVDNVSFSIKEGEIFSLIGPNSSGKTTIVKNIIGLLEPTKGNITINGFDISKDKEKAKALIGYIPDEPSIWPYMTGEEFINFTKALFFVKDKNHKKDYEKLISEFDLNGVEKKYFEEYSRGNKQKFSIISAMSHKPKLLLIDEPIVGLDPTSASIAKDLFVKYKKSGGAILLVTHTLPVAQEISDRIGVLKNGELIAIGTFEELKEKAKLGDTVTLEDVYKKLT